MSPTTPSRRRRRRRSRCRRPRSPAVPVRGTVRRRRARRGRRASARCRPIARARRRIVAVLAGTALFVVGLVARPPVGADPGHARRARRTRSSRSGTPTAAITERYAGGDVDRKALVEGAIKGMIGALGDPYSQYMTPGRVQGDASRARPASSRGSAPTIGTVDAAGATVDLHDARAGVPARRRRARSRGRRPRRRACSRATSSTRSTARRSTGLTVDDGARTRSAARRTRRSSSRSSAAAARRSTSRSCAPSSSSPRSRREDLADGAVGYIKLAGFSDHAADAVRRRGQGGRRRRPEAAHRRPARQPGRLRHRGARHREPVPRRRDDLLAGGRRGQPDRDRRRKPGRRRDRPVDPARPARRRRIGVRVRDRRRRAPRPGPGDARRQKTFGKGTVQQWTQLEDDSGGFRLTIAKWLTPDKTWVHERGHRARTSWSTRRGRPRPATTRSLDAALKALGGRGDGARRRRARCRRAACNAR